MICITTSSQQYSRNTSDICYITIVRVVGRYAQDSGLEFLGRTTSIHKIPVILYYTTFKKAIAKISKTI